MDDALSTLPGMKQKSLCFLSGNNKCFVYAEAQMEAPGYCHAQRDQTDEKRLRLPLRR
jgi:hypothetical protein